VPDPNPQQQEPAPRRDDRRDDRPAPQAVPQTPDMVWADEFEDHGWRAAAAKKPHQRSRSEQLTVQAGPKRHPFPEGKVHVEEVSMPDGTRRLRYFADGEKAQAHRASSGETLEVQTLSQPEQSEEQLRQAQAQREHALQARQAVNALEATTEPPAGQPAPVQARIDQMNARARAQEIQTQGVTGVPPRSAAEARRARGQPER
jgi:hypothetical protein